MGLVVGAVLSWLEFLVFIDALLILSTHNISGPLPIDNRRTARDNARG